MMRVNQFHNKNQFVIEGEGKRIFQSYDSTIAVIDDKGNVTLGKDWNYSKTTSKHRALFLGEDTKTTARKLKEGVYKLDESL